MANDGHTHSNAHTSANHAASTPVAKAKPEKGAEQVVELSDGRLVTFVGKRKLIKESFVNPDSSVSVRLDFRNGVTRTFTIPDSLLLKFAAHGAEQKLGDETAGVEDIDDMVLGVDELIERLEKGEWSIAREGGTSVAGTSVLSRALMELGGKTAEQVKAFLKPLGQKEKTALRNSPRLKPIIERIENEKASKLASIDTDALLSGLDAA